LHTKREREEAWGFLSKRKAKEEGRKHVSFVKTRHKMLIAQMILSALSSFVLILQQV
jgi:hypothetical protein